MNKFLKKNYNNIKPSYRQFEIVCSLSLPMKIKDFINTLSEFFQIWPLQQWIFSLLGLIFSYLITINLYNKRLKKKELEPISKKGCFWMIFIDLLINLIVGLYYFKKIKLPMGIIMLKCPIAISPIIFIIEFFLVCLWKNRHTIIYHIIENFYENKQNIYAYSFIILFPYYFIAINWQEYFFLVILGISLYNWKWFPMNFYWKPLETWKMLQRIKMQKKAQIIKEQKHKLLTELNLLDLPAAQKKKKKSNLKELPTTLKKENAEKTSPKT